MRRTELRSTIAGVKKKVRRSGYRHELHKNTKFEGKVVDANETSTLFDNGLQLRHDAGYDWETIDRIQRNNY